jgi:hypothetical protein
LEEKDGVEVDDDGPASEPTFEFDWCWPVMDFERHVKRKKNSF